MFLSSFWLKAFFVLAITATALIPQAGAQNTNQARFIRIEAGTYHSLALKSDGTVATWGGQTTAPGGLTGVVAIAAGNFHSLALKSDGTVVAWGDNSYGQSVVPDGLNGMIAIAAGGYHNLALRSDGTIVAWGLNNHDQSRMPGGGILLNEGQSYSHNFTFGPPWWVSSITVSSPSFTTVLNGFDTGESVLIEIFENSTSESPIGSSTFTAPVNQSPRTTAFEPGAWNDRQGAVRVTALRGSFQLEQLSMRKQEVVAYRTFNDYNYRYIIPVSEAVLGARRIGASLEISFSTLAGMSDDLQRSTNLFSWESIETIGPYPENTRVVRQTVPSTGPPQFFRVKRQ